MLPFSVQPIGIVDAGRIIGAGRISHAKTNTVIGVVLFDYLGTVFHDQGTEIIGGIGVAGIEREMVEKLASDTVVHAPAAADIALARRFAAIDLAVKIKDGAFCGNAEIVRERGFQALVTSTDIEREVAVARIVARARRVQVHPVQETVLEIDVEFGA